MQFLKGFMLPPWACVAIIAIISITLIVLLLIAANKAEELQLLLELLADILSDSVNTGSCVPY